MKMYNKKYNCKKIHSVVWQIGRTKKKTERKPAIRSGDAKKKNGKSEKWKPATVFGTILKLK